jgi:hypothetical protein
MAFGPDDKLYVTIGDATQNTVCGNLPNSTGAICPAQDPSSLLGKVLRINKDGSIPKDNPYPDSPVFNIGHLNMYGIAFDNSGFGLVSENGRFHYDEINTIERATNYGSPTIQIPDSDPENSTDSSKPLRSYYDAKCLTSLIFYNGDKITELKGKFLVGTFESSSPIYALQVDVKSKQIVGELAIFLDNFLNNQVVALAQSPTGELYYASYEINKLDSINSTKKLQTLFPIVMNFSSPIINITHLSFNPSKQEIRIDADSGTSTDNLNNEHDIKSDDSMAYLTVTIPKQLLRQIDSVTSNIDNQTRIQTKNLDYSIQDLSKLNDTIVNISFKDEGHYRLLISGK